MGENTINHLRALMSGIYKHAAALGYVNSNPIHSAKVLVTPSPPKETRHYIASEMGTALWVLEELQARLAMALAFIGLRPSEIRGLRREDVNLETGVLHIRRSAWRNSINQGGKGKSSERDVTIGPTLIGLLSEYQKSYLSQRVLCWKIVLAVR